MEKTFTIAKHNIIIKPTHEIELQGMPVDIKRVREANAIFREYQKAKQDLEQRIIENEEWYKLKHWEYIRNKQSTTTGPNAERPEPATAWLFDSLANKHADAMDNYPEANVLPREQSDEQEAKTLQSILPVILERCKYQKIYSRAWWDKLKHGTSVKGVFWDPTAENGLGDIAIKQIDLLNIFWEPGIEDIQDSANLFITKLVNLEKLKADYPKYADMFTSNAYDVKQYIHNQTIDMSEKTVVVDWYYKVRQDNGDGTFRTILHYAKFVGEALLFSSENEAHKTTGTERPLYQNGLYEHGKYPVEFDVLYPLKGTPVGFGLVDICKDPQVYIDKLGQAILENAVIGARPRYLSKEGTGIDMNDFTDLSKQIVRYTGNPDDNKPIEHPKLDAIYFSVYQQKIDEMKETSANRDFSAGGTSGGVTAAAAIAALQEAGNKRSRDMINESYLAFAEECNLVIELIRQFYSIKRAFRITAENGYEYILYSNQNIAPRQVQDELTGRAFTRKPIFDVTVKPQRRNPFSRNAQNQLAVELYQLGFFNPQLAEQTLTALELMDFEGKEKIRERIQQGQTMMMIIQQLQMALAQRDQLIAQLTGQPLQTAQPAGNAAPAAIPRQTSTSGITQVNDRATDINQNSYAQKIVERGTKVMEG